MTEPTTAAGRALRSGLMHNGEDDYVTAILAIEAEARAAALDEARLSAAIHEYGGVCRSRYGRRTCKPADHRVMAEGILAAIDALREGTDVS